MSKSKIKHKGPSNSQMLYPTHYSAIEGEELQPCAGSLPVHLLELQRRNRTPDSRHIWWRDKDGGSTQVHAIFKLNGNELIWRWDALNGFTVWEGKQVEP